MQASEILTIWLIAAVAVAIVARQKGHPAAPWFVYGLLISPVAFVHILMKPRSAEGMARAARAEGRLPCPDCAEPILPAARICPHCRSTLSDGWAAAIRAASLAADGLPADAPGRKFGETEQAYRSRLQAGGYVR